MNQPLKELGLGLAPTNLNIRDLEEHMVSREEGQKEDLALIPINKADDR